MAGRGGNDVILEGGMEKFSAAIRRAGEELFECITDPKIGTIGVMGYNGVGNWRIVEYATQKLKGSHLFDMQILVKLPRRDFNQRRVMKGIANQLGLTLDLNPDYDDHAQYQSDDDRRQIIIAASDVYRSLMKGRFLVISGDVTRGTDLESMAFYSMKEYSKVVLVGDDTRQLIRWECDLSIGLEELSNDMLREEAADVAHSPGVEGWLSPEAVLDCLLYLWFFFGEPRDMTLNVEELTRNWIADAFIIRDETEESTLMEKVLTLLRELELRSLMEFNKTNNGWEVPRWVSENARAMEGALTHGRYWTQEYPPEENSEWEDILRMNLWGIDASTHLPQVPPKCPKLSALQLGRVDRHYSSVEFVIPDPFFQQMQSLRVLHLYNLHIKSLPPSIAFLHNLRLLRIKGCTRLESLPSSFQDLRKLEFLEVSQSSSFMSMPDDCFRQMTNLQFLLLDGTNIESLPSSVSKLCTLRQLILINSHSLMEIPDENFEYMQRLQVLDLGGDSNLKFLPSSFSKSVHLRRLILSNCSSLKMKLRPHLRNLSALEELDLGNCISLEDIEDVSSSLGSILPNLRKLDLSGIVAIRWVSLIGCQSLESLSLNGLTRLQVLSLSGTIKSFPENMIYTGHLKRLDMLSMDHLQEIKWNDLSTELEHLNINQCGTLNSSADNDEWPENMGGAHIRVSNHRLLQSLQLDSKLWGAKCFSRFYVCISPCQETVSKRQFLYASIGSKTQTCNLPPPSHFDRHLEIRGGDTSPNGIQGVLGRMELFTLCDNAFVQRLSYLGSVNEMTELKECRVERCKQMEIFFEGKNERSNTLSCLETIWMSNLARLRSVCEGTYGRRSFTLLKHIYLECCPRLVVVFSSDVCLQSLETLRIKFCSRLEVVFRGEATTQGSLQRLHTVCLWELPKLESICSSVYLPALKKLRVSGCGKLNRLPLCVPPDNVVAASTAIGGRGAEVKGELVRGASLMLEGESINFEELHPLTREKGAQIRRAGEELLECLTDPKIRSVVVVGYNGVGRWRIIDYATRKLNESHLFDVQILVKLRQRDFSNLRMLKEIAHQLGLTANFITYDDRDIESIQRELMLAVGDTWRSLMRRRFLLIVGDVTKGSNVELMAYYVAEEYPYDSKVVLVGDDTRQLEVWKCDLSISLKELSNDMLRQEAADIAHSPGVEGWLTPEAVLDCCLYVWFFFGESRDMRLDVEWLTRNCMAEGFLIREGTEEDDEEEDSKFMEKAPTLLRELELHSLLVEFNESKNDWKAPGWVFENARALEGALTHGRYWIQKSPPGENSQWEDILKMNLQDISSPLPQAPPKCPKLSTLQLGLVNSPCSNVEFVIPELFFKQMQALRVLHLYNLHIKSLPPSIAFLFNLRLLRIKGCTHLESLPSSFQALHKLEFLEISESPLHFMPDDCFQQMTNLRYLLLDGTNIKSLPSSLSKLHNLRQHMLVNSCSLMEIPYKSFECMQRLRVLDLSGDSNLKFLPSSFSKLVDLRRLILANCSSLKMKLLQHLQNLSAIEELDLCNCNSLEDIEDVSLGKILPKLRKLNLSGIVAIRRVSMIGFQSLESLSLNGLASLQVLTLLGTKIKSFPENMNDTGHLKRLDMLGMDHLQEIKWDAISTELEHLNINQCGTLNTSADNHEWPGNMGWAHIRVSNHRLLQSLKPDSKLWRAKCFSRFYVCISPCQENEPRRRFLYANIGSNIQTCNLPPPTHFDKHLEIRGGDTSPNGISGVLSQMELFTLCDNAFVQRLSDMGDVRKMKELKECRVERCKQMEIFFEVKNERFEDENEWSYTLYCLEKIWMSNLARLRSVCEGTYGSQSFTLLKHIYLEYCPRLVVVFSSGVCLQSLETLHIKFCGRLEAVFQGVATEQGSLQRLHTVCLWELPKLKSMCSGVCLPSLKKLRVSGCRQLNKLPLRVSPDNAASTSTAISGGSVEVEGESVWWANLKLDGDCIERHVHFKERRPFTRC